MFSIKQNERFIIQTIGVVKHIRLNPRLDKV